MPRNSKNDHPHDPQNLHQADSESRDALARLRVDTGEYRRDKIYSRSTDGKGFSRTLKIRFAPHVMHLMQSAASSGPGAKFFGGNTHALVRDAVIHSLKWLQDNHGLIPPSEWLANWSIEMSQRRIAQIEAYEEAERQMVEAFDAMIRVGDMQALEDDLFAYEQRFSGWPEPYKTRIQSRILNYRLRYGPR